MVVNRCCCCCCTHQTAKERAWRKRFVLQPLLLEPVKAMLPMYLFGSSRVVAESKTWAAFGCLLFGKYLKIGHAAHILPRASIKQANKTRVILTIITLRLYTSQLVAGAAMATHPQLSQGAAAALWWADMAEEAAAEPAAPPSCPLPTTANHSACFLAVINVAGDGNCLFHALAYFFYPVDGMALREELIAFLERGALDQPGFEAEWLEEAERLRAVAWGGFTAIAAVSLMKSVRIKVHIVQHTGMVPSDHSKRNQPLVLPLQKTLRCLGAGHALCARCGDSAEPDDQSPSQLRLAATTRTQPAPVECWVCWLVSSWHGRRGCPTGLLA